MQHWKIPSNFTHFTSRSLLRYEWDQMRIALSELGEDDNITIDQLLNWIGATSNWVWRSGRILSTLLHNDCSCRGGGAKLSLSYCVLACVGWNGPWFKEFQVLLIDSSCVVYLRAGAFLVELRRCVDSRTLTIWYTMHCKMHLVTFYTRQML